LPTDESTATYGFAHVEFASTEEAIRAARQGAPHGFRYEKRLLDVDFAPWIFYVGPGYRVVYISDWPPSKGRSALWQWASDIPNLIGTTIRTYAHSYVREKKTQLFLKPNSTHLPNLPPLTHQQWLHSAAKSALTRVVHSCNSGP
jgi:hypothetical protein